MTLETQQTSRRRATSKQIRALGNLWNFRLRLSATLNFWLSLSHFSGMPALVAAKDIHFWFQDSMQSHWILHICTSQILILADPYGQGFYMLVCFALAGCCGGLQPWSIILVLLFLLGANFMTRYYWMCRLDRKLFPNFCSRNLTRPIGLDFFMTLVPSIESCRIIASSNIEAAYQFDRRCTSTFSKDSMAPRSIGLDNKSDESKSQIYILELETHGALSCILAFFLACETLLFISVLSSHTYLCVAAWPLI
jgi:hypothetical protein